MTDMDKLEGVPPNISVKIITPSPLPTDVAASTMALRRSSISSFGKIDMASICC